MKFKDFVAPSEPKGWLVEKLIPCGHKVLVAGKPGACKSWFTEALAVAVASGTPFLGYPVKPGNVLLFDEDSPEDDLKRRLRQLMTGAGISNPEHELEVICMKGTVLDNPTSVQQVEEHIKVIQPVLVVFDVLTKMVSHLDINKPKDMAVLNSRLDTIRAVCDSTIVISHHMGKKNSREYLSLVMGSSTLVGNSDTAFGIWPVDRDMQNETRFGVQPIPRKVKLNIPPFKVGLCEGLGSIRLERLCSWIPELEADAELIGQVLSLFMDDNDSRTVREVYQALSGLASEEKIRNVLRLLSQPGMPLELRSGPHNRFKYRLRPGCQDSLSQWVKHTPDGNKEGETGKSNKLESDSSIPVS
jgi:hypothetical protein